MINKLNHDSSIFKLFIDNSVKKPSIKTQQNFFDIINRISKLIFKICEDEKLIIDLNYQPKKVWNKAKSYKSCFIDGGVYSSVLSSSAPFAIRAKSFIVQPNLKINDREKFEETISYMGDLYDPDNTVYDLSEDPYEDNQLITKKKDAARITFEIAAIVKHVFGKQKFDYCFLHGPLQTPIMPFSGPEFPLFKQSVVQSILPFFKQRLKTQVDRHFINVYLNSLIYLKNSSKFPIYGVVERTGSTIYLRNLLNKTVKKGHLSEAEKDKMFETIKRYKINDSNIFELILKDTQALKPIEVEKQIPSKAWGEWQDQMDSFPKVFISYIKTNPSHPPIRIESLNEPKNLVKDFEYILATCKLLPNYGFPVGLDIVDKAAKIPSWLGRTAKSYYLKYYLNLAVKNNDSHQISNALKTISKKGRNWDARPKAGGQIR